MNRIRACLILALAAGQVLADTTIDSVNRYAYGANIGWVDFHGDTNNGAVIGEYVCSGYFWAANVGWVHLGDGTPANGLRYENASADDFGVNHDGRGNLRGYAYGANIGWINFHSNGAPRVDFETGALDGYFYSANCGWINLSNAFAFVRTDIIQPGADADGDGITDGWELSYTNTLVTFTEDTDTDGDGASDLNEHLADTSPLDPGDYLRITSYSVQFGGGSETNLLTWTSEPSRLYQVNYRNMLGADTPWLDATALLHPDPGSHTTWMFTLSPPLLERYFRIEAVKPLAP